MEVSPVISAWVIFPKHRLVHHCCNQTLFSVRAIRKNGVRVKIHCKRVVDAVDKDFLIKGIFPCVTGIDSPIAPSHANGIVKCGVIGGISVGVHLDVAGNSLDHLGDLVVCQVIHRVNFDAGALLTLLVSHLPDIRINLVNGQAWAGFQVAAVLNLNRPLIASGKLNVVQGFCPIGRVGIINHAPELDRFIDLVFISSFVLVSHIQPFISCVIISLAHPTANISNLC